jgi:hypothetical protein
MVDVRPEKIDRANGISGAAYLGLCFQAKYCQHCASSTMPQGMLLKAAS